MSYLHFQLNVDLSVTLVRSELQITKDLMQR